MILCSVLMVSMERMSRVTIVVAIVLQGDEESEELEAAKSEFRLGIQYLCTQHLKTFG